MKPNNGKNLVYVQLLIFFPSAVLCDSHQEAIYDMNGVEREKRRRHIKSPKRVLIENSPSERDVLCAGWLIAEKSKVRTAISLFSAVHVANNASNRCGKSLFIQKTSFMFFTFLGALQPENRVSQLKLIWFFAHGDGKLSNEAFCQPFHTEQRRRTLG